MAGEKSEKPTERRISEARKRGQVAKSADLNAAIVMATVTGLMMATGPYMFNTLYALCQQTFTHLSSRAMDLTMFNSLLTDSVQALILLILPWTVGIMVMAVLGNLLQVKPLFTTEPLKPQWSRLNPLQGFKRLWSMRSAVETGKALLKMAIIGGCGYSILKSHEQELLALSRQEITAAFGSVVGLIGTLALWTTVLYFVLGLADYLYQRYELMKQLRMTKQEIRDERKNIEGNPEMKGRIRQVGRQMMRKRQLAAIPTADVIINNPTHISIAIQYDPDMAPAPRVVAKGQEHFAMKMREVAQQHGIPMVENKPLARSLYAAVEVDHMIPPELFVAVAEVLAFVFSKNKGRKPKRRTETQNPLSPRVPGGDDA